MSSNNKLSQKFFTAVTLASAGLLSKAYAPACTRPMTLAGLRRRRIAQHLRRHAGRTLRLCLATRAGRAESAEILSTICVDKVVHSLEKSNLSGTRKRIFCHCPQFELAFLHIQNSML